MLTFIEVPVCFCSDFQQLSNNVSVLFKFRLC